MHNKVSTEDYVISMAGGVDRTLEGPRGAPCAPSWVNTITWLIDSAASGIASGIELGPVWNPQDWSNPSGHTMCLALLCRWLLAPAI